MTEEKQPTTPQKKRPHAARSARILSTGMSATAILGMVAAYGAAEKKAASIDEFATPDISAVSPLDVTTLPAPGLAPLDATTATVAPVTVATTSAPPAQTPSAVGVSGKVSPISPATGDVAVAPVSPETVPAPLETVAPVQTAAPVQTVVPVETVAPAPPPVQLTVPASPPQGRTSGSN